MREAKITSDRENCRALLEFMFPRLWFMSGHWWETKSLSERIEIDEAECQEILNELVIAKFVEESSQRYHLTDKILSAWKEAYWQL